jgi:hypothetical protein
MQPWKRDLNKSRKTKKKVRPCIGKDSNSASLNRDKELRPLMYSNGCEQERKPLYIT